ncbi:MAG: hypothetical protein KI788_17920 [Mameliella sp.]|nr:hypothetical protein [Mameliella sp.]
MPHDIVNGHIGHHHHHPHDHNHPHDHDHLHSHLPPEDEAAELQVLATQFIDGFVQAADKTAYLRLAGVPFERPGSGGAKALKLVDVELKTEWQVGTASPSFGTRELSYLPFPGEMVSERTNMALVYVSMEEKTLWDIRQFLRERMAGQGD